MKVLLVGGSGHVGSFITPYLQRQHDVRVLDLAPPRVDNVEYIQGSVTDPVALRASLDGMDSFVNLVMRSPQGGALTDQTLEEITDNYEVNTLGLHLLLHTAAGLGIRRGVHTSTLSVHYRRREWYESEEHVPLDSASVYGLTKGFGELICQYFARWFDMNLIALRISYPRTREQWLAERGQTIYSAEDVQVYPLDEEDLANAYLAALEVVGAGHGRFDAVFVVGDSGQTGHNLSKAERLLGWRPRANDCLQTLAPAHGEPLKARS